MAELENITVEEARMRLLRAYGKSTDGSFVAALQRPLLNPVEQRDEKNRRRVHPMAIVGLVLMAVAGVSAAVFSFDLWGV